MTVNAEQMNFYVFTKTGMINRILACIVFLYAGPAYAQTNTVDSLEKLLKIAKQDTNKVIILMALGKEFRYSNTDTALYFAKSALALATKLNYEMGIADSKRGICALYASQGKFDDGIKSGNEALAIYNKLHASATGPEKEKIAAKIGATYTVIGHNWISQGNGPEGLKNSLLALKIQGQLGDKKTIAATEYNIGNVYSMQHNYSEALRYYYASMKIFEELRMKSELAYVYNTIGWVHIQRNNYAEALKQCLIALRIAEETKEKNVLAEIYNDLGLIYSNQGNFNEALKYDFAALKMFEEAGIHQQLPDIYNNIGLVYMKEKKYTYAGEYFYKALTFSKKIGSLELTKWSYENWASLDSAQGNFKKALEDYKLAIVYRDSMVNEENTKKMVQQEMQYRFDKTQDSLRGEQDKKDALALSQIKNQKLVRNFSLTGAFAIVSFGGYSFYRYRRRRKLQSQQELLNERLRISRELHDDIGSTLGSISIYSEVAKNRSEKNENADEAISKIGVASRELIEKMSDIVWSINPTNESFEQLQNRMQAFAAMTLTPRDIQNDFIVDDEVKKLQLSTEERKNIFLIFKEAIHNIVKYAECSKVEIRMSLQSNQLEVQIKDDGKGFEASPLRRLNDSGWEETPSLGGNGMKNMKARADDIGASLNVHSVKNGGTRIGLVLNI